MNPVVPYSRYAALYDRTGQDAFSRRAWEYVRAKLKRLEWRGRRVLDLACGTGAALEPIAADGLSVWGADLSREMLLNARLTTAHPLARADLRALPFADASFDLLTCFYDSLNYLPTPADLAMALAEAARVLAPGGLLVFDLNTRYTLKHHWEGVCHTRLSEDLATIWTATWDETTGLSSLKATFFVQGEDGRWDRFDEVHDERGFKNSELTEAIAAAGLEASLIEDYQTGRRPGEDSRRVFYFLRAKAAGKRR